MFFYDSALLAVKWRNYKVHFQVRNTADGMIHATKKTVEEAGDKATDEEKEHQRAAQPH